ncbi:hypothetical protein BJ138DRAFT_1139639 [Hygrophoropsis aurantiaca]|uniref:Uncharacterized protein n=1 Tax=Hygrophoropsis aurantiaca TaxID=72124 RepID=A0ACB8AUE8_9AGAM|nr:hypothetical protein BJ138DRAFT_1139639 [Hygrophoropsis aurantiaca]
MAIGKWNPFGQQVQVTPDDPVVKPLPIPCADGKQFGLENFGNTCYANSVLQALYFCSPFRELVIQHTDPYGTLQSISPQLPAIINPASPSVTTPTRRKPERKSTQDSAHPNGIVHPPTPPVPSSPRTLFSALRSLYIHISRNPAEKGTIAPKAFIDKLKELNEAFRNTMHQDAHEFLNYLLNRIVEEMEEEKKQLHASGDDLPSSLSSSFTSHPPAPTTGSTSSSTSPGATFIHQIFEGVLTSETRCLTCENVSSRDESFLDLSIDIEQNSSVTACLRQFSASEMLCQKNKFFCDGCCDLQEAEKRMKIKRLPNVLALHLKRFKYQEDVQRYIKLTYRVAFPFELRLFNTVDDAQNPDRLYELFAIVVHIGSGPNHGHYVSIIKTLGTWLIFDDETVDTIKESDIPKYFGEANAGSAYVLYYQAADLDLTSLGLRPPPSAGPTIQPEQEGTIDQHLTTESPDWLPHSIPTPPGLTASSERTETPTPPPVSPSVPPQISTVASPSEESPRKSPSQLSKINLGPPSSTPTYPATVGPGSSPTANSPAKNSFFSSFRNPSPKVSHDSKPALSPVIVFPKGDNASPESLPILPPIINTDKESEKKPGNWFRRKSLKGSVKPRPMSEATGHIPALPPDLSIGASSSPARLHTAGATSKQSKDLGPRRPSEPVLDRSFPTPFTSRRPTTAGGHKVTASQDRSIRREPSSPAPLNAAVPTSPPSEYPSHSRPRPLPSVPSSPQYSNGYTHSPPSAYTRGSSDYARTRRQPLSANHFERSPSPPRIPARPSTAGGALGSRPSRQNEQSLLPPLPMNGRLPIRGHDERSPVSPHADHGRTRARTEGPSSEESGSSRPKSVHASAGLSIGATIGGNHSSSTNDSTVSSSAFPARRKMSFTAPLLGFARRDKDKHKEKEKKT